MYVPLGIDNCAIGWGVHNFVCVINSEYVAINAVDWSQFTMEIFERCTAHSAPPGSLSGFSCPAK